MKTKTFLFPIVAVLALFLATTVSAAQIANSGLAVSFKDIQLTSSDNIVGYVGETVPVRVAFTANRGVSDARIKIRVEGHREDIYASSRRLTLVNNSVYTELLNLKLPSDLKTTLKDYTLYVEVSSATDRTEASYNLRMQRESYDLDVLSVDYDLDAVAGSSVPVLIVVKNTGFERSDDAYASVTIPEIGASARAYLGDLVAMENCTEGCDDEDSVSKILYLRLPENAAPGVYDMIVTVSNSDSRSVEKRVLKISPPATSSFIATSRNQDIRPGETKTFDLVIVNSDSKIKAYTLTSLSSSVLEVTVPSVITVGPQTAYTVPVTVKAKSNAEVGSYTFTVSANGQQTSFVANVVGKTAASRGVVVLTVILAIIFVALLILLIALLIKREKPTEEVETSYY